MEPSKARSSFNKIKNISKLISSSDQISKREIAMSPTKDEPKKQITIKDLCIEEKNKIGNLIKKLAEEKTAKDELTIRYDKQIKEINARLEEVKTANDSLLKENSTLNLKLKHSIQLLEESKKTADTLKSELTASQNKCMTPVAPKEMRSQSVSTSPKNMSNRLQTKLSQLQIGAEQKETEKYKEKEITNEIRKDREKVKEENTDNTLNEIKGLKSEILNLTNVLKTINFTPSRMDKSAKETASIINNTENVYTTQNDYSANKSLKYEEDLRQSRMSKSKERIKEEILRIKSDYRKATQKTNSPQRNIESATKSIESLNSQQMQSVAANQPYANRRKKEEFDKIEATQANEQKPFDDEARESEYVTGSFPRNPEYQAEKEEDKSISVSPIVEDIKKSIRQNTDETIKAKDRSADKNIYDPSLFSLIEEIEQEKLSLPQPSKMQYDSTYRKYEEVGLKKVEKLYKEPPTSYQTYQNEKPSVTNKYDYLTKKSSQLKTSLRADEKIISGLGQESKSSGSKVYYPGFLAKQY